MSLIDYFFGKKAKTASIAKERLQVIIAHEHESASALAFLPEMREEIIKVIAKYMPHIQKESIKVQQEKRENMDFVKVSIPLQK